MSHGMDAPPVIFLACLLFATGAAAQEQPSGDEGPAAEEAEGRPRSDEYRDSELEIVFQGAVGRSASEAPAIPQIRDDESSRLFAGEKDPAAEAVTDGDGDGGIDIWTLARREPPLLPDEPAGHFRAGLNLGYSWLHGRGAGAGNAFNPVIHLGLDASYQVFRLLSLALAADFDYLAGAAAAGHELLPEHLGPREVGAILDNYVGLGLRPTLRLNIRLPLVEWVSGIGMGWHWFRTSGRWRAKISGDDPSNVGDEYGAPPIRDQPQWSKGEDETVYSFEMSNHGLYVALDTALMVRLLDGRLGAGLFLKYTSPIHTGIEPEVEVERGEGHANDYRDTLVRHLGSLSLLTLGLAADYRF